MDLIERIEQALATQSVDATEFERCAVALLQVVYRGLSAVEGGHDFGRDADVYFPLDPSQRGRLLATTMQEVRANVSRGLGRMEAEGLSADLLVVATSRPLSASQRRSIEALAARHGIPNTHIYARDWFVERLAKDPGWRQRLLGVTGELGALVRVPLSTLAQPVTGVGLVGRSEDLEALATLLANGSDVVLSGVLGSGKTRLLTELDGKIYFLEPAAEERVIDDLRIHSPEVIVVDDSYDRPEELQLLRRARLQEGFSFKIVATIWPEQAERVLDTLPGAEQIDLGLLTPKPMEELIRSAGVTAYTARSLILDQAGGRPGWALALVEALRRRGGNDIVSGAALFEQVEWFLRRSAQSEVAVDALACVAALDPCRDEDLVPLAQLVGIPLVELTKVLSGSATNGLLDRTPEGWRLLPPLRAPLMARWFFADPPRRPWSTLETAFPGHLDRLQIAIMRAASTGAQGPLDEADRWARSLDTSQPWDLGIWTAVEAYAILSEDRAAWAIRHARATLASTRRTITYPTFGVTIDPIGSKARELLVAATQRHLLHEAIIGLLDLSLGDDRPRPQTPQHPLRVLTDLAKSFHPDFGTSVEIRKRILEPTLAWLASELSEQRWDVVAEVVEAVFSVRVSGSWLELGRPRTITITGGIDSAEHLDELISLWSEKIDPILHIDAEPAVKPSTDAVARLLNLADDWLSLGTGRHLDPEQATEDHARVGAAGGAVMMTTLRPHLAVHPGLAVRAQRILDDNGRSDLEAFALDADLVALVDGDIDVDYEAYLAERDRTLSGLAERLGQLAPETAVPRFAELTDQAALAGGFTEHIWLLAEKLQQYMTDPLAWLAAALEANSSPLLTVALDAALKDPGITPDLDLLRQILDEKELRASVISTVLSRPDVSPAAELILSDLGAGDARLTHGIALRHDKADPIHHRLLTHPVTDVASAVVLSFSIGICYGPPLPPEWRTDWEAAIVQMGADDLDHSLQQRAGLLLRHLAGDDPDLFERWFNARLDEILPGGFLHPPGPYGSEKALARLPEQHRERLIRRWAGVPHAGRSLLSHLLAAPDTGLTVRLLDEGVIETNDVLAAMLGRPAMLQALGPILVRRGVDPSTVASTAEYEEGRWGEESDALRTRLESFQNLLDTEDVELRAIAEAGVERAESGLAAALEDEHRRRIRGEL